MGPNADIPEDLSPAFIASITTHDIAVNYQLNDTVTVFGGVRNVFDDVPVGRVTNALYDLVGRRAYFGLRAGF